jgi:hypothetical protein
MAAIKGVGIWYRRDSEYDYFRSGGIKLGRRQYTHVDRDQNHSNIRDLYRKQVRSVRIWRQGLAALASMTCQAVTPFTFQRLCNRRLNAPALTSMVLDSGGSGSEEINEIFDCTELASAGAASADSFVPVLCLITTPCLLCISLVSSRSLTSPLPCASRTSGTGGGSLCCAPARLIVVHAHRWWAQAKGLRVKIICICAGVSDNERDLYINDRLAYLRCDVYAVVCASKRAKLMVWGSTVQRRERPASSTVTRNLRDMQQAAQVHQQGCNSARTCGNARALLVVRQGQLAVWREQALRCCMQSSSNAVVYTGKTRE